MSKLKGNKGNAKSGTNRVTRSDVPGNGAIVAGYPTIGWLSNDPVHKGTHNEPGTFDITDRGRSTHGDDWTWEQVRDDLIKKFGNDIIVAIRTPGESGIITPHIHAAIISKSPKEAQRLRAQMKAGKNVWDADKLRAKQAKENAVPGKKSGH